MICSPGSTCNLNISSTKRCTSLFFIVSSILLRVMIPVCCELLICCPAIPTYTDFISTCDFSCASFTALRMAFTVCSTFTTPSFLSTPIESALPIPNISILLFSFRLPTIAQIFVVPISNPTTISFSFKLLIMLLIFC